jgi:hypothetical protein
MRSYSKYFAVAGALAALAAVPSVASANVPRCQAPVTEPATATFTVTSPTAPGDWGSLWHHDFTVTVQPNGSFTGSDHVYGPTADFTELTTGTFNSDGTVSLTSSRDPYYVSSWSLDHAVMDGATIADATTQPEVPWVVEMRVSPPEMSAPTTTDMNHGQYVKSQGGGKEAAQSCIGMPLNSTEGR